MADRHHFERPLNRHNSAMVRQISMKFGMMAHFDPVKPNDLQKFDLKKSRTPMSGLVHGRYTQSDSAKDRTGRVRMLMGCILAQPGEYD